MKRNKWLPMVLAVVAIGVLGGGYMILDQMSREEDEVETVAVPTLSGEIDSIEYQRYGKGVAGQKWGCLAMV